MTYCRSCLSVPCACDEAMGRAPTPTPPHVLEALVEVESLCLRSPARRLSPHDARLANLVGLRRQDKTMPTPVFTLAFDIELRGNCLRTVAWIASLAFALMFALGLLSGCSQAHESLETRVVHATLDAWADVGLPEPRDGCRIEQFRIERPGTVAAFQRTCSAPGTDPTQVHDWACLVWRLESPRARELVYPAAVISPLLAADRDGAMASHELLHAIGRCSGMWSQGDPYDRLHTDERVWETGGPDSVETRAETILVLP